MSRTFAVIDAGSNAIRLQIAAVEQPGIYRILAEDRIPVRLGHRVFETRRLDPKSRAQALEALARLKDAAASHGVSALRAVATSAVREAQDRAAFIEAARALGVELDVLSEEDEAALIREGILSGLKVRPAAGIFIDIGGGSVELSAAGKTGAPAMVSLPLGAVRLTERFLQHDPPTEGELATMNRHIREVLDPATHRLPRESSTAAFSCGGTLTALASLDARTGGDSFPASLYRVRRSRLQSHYELIRALPADERAALLGGDPRRADIVVAGAAVLLAVLDAFGLDAVSVSVRGLRDGLMVDLLRRSYESYGGPWNCG